MKVFDIAEKGLLFKNLISGPAPAGRILNYTYLCGQGKLRHKNGHRYTNLHNDIGYAWTTEFMIGLEIVELGASIGDAFILNLTPKGTKLYKILQKQYFNFCEGVRSNDITKLRNEINSYDKQLYIEYKNAFVSSYPFQILKEFLNENGFYYHDRKAFMDDYFEYVKNAYDEDPSPYNRNARTTTGENRVPSLLQLCSLFDFLREGSDLSFDMVAINNAVVSNDDDLFDIKELIKESEEQELEIKELSKLDVLSKYGYDGNVLRSMIVRNSFLQTKFRHNLIVKNKCKCMICDIKTKEILRASHIRPASVSNAFQKVDDNNGLLLCANHDALFDQYLITFNFLDGQIKISSTIINDKDEMERLNLDESYSLSMDLLTTERVSYLMEHNLEFERLETERIEAER